MSTLKYCDIGHHPYSAQEVGSQNIQATTVFVNDSGHLDSRHELFDVCAKHAFGNLASQINAPMLMGGVIQDDDSDTTPAEVTDKGGDNWTYDSNDGLYHLDRDAAFKPRTLIDLRRTYGVKA